MQENLENTLASLVAIPSAPNDSFACHAVMNFVHDELKTYNLTIEDHFDTTRPWLVATTQVTKTPDILFYCHLDVIPAPSHMFQMEKQNGRLLGRGVFDMKFAAACYLEFLRNHNDSLSDLNIGFLFTTDEERDSACMSEVIATGLRPKVVFMPDGGGNWEIEKRSKGFLAIELVATGTTAHGSRPWEGDNALHSLLDIIKPLREKYMLQEKEHPTLMINSIQSGQAVNQIPDLAIAKIDFRCFNQHEMDEYKMILNDMLVQHPNLTLNVQNSGETIEFDESSPHVKGFLRTFKQLRGTLPTYTDSYGGADSRFFNPLGIPSIIIEPRGGDRHGDNEWLEASDLAKYYELVERWIFDDAKIGHISSHHRQTLRTPERVGKLV